MILPSISLALSSVVRGAIMTTVPRLNTQVPTTFFLRNIMRHKSDLAAVIKPVIKYPPDCRNQFSVITIVKFPEYSALQCNMMPFRMGDKHSLPNEYQHYWNLIEACKVPEQELGQVGYLTVSESEVKEGFTQRRPGLHTEKHPERTQMNPWGGGWGSGWGGGNDKGSGLYIASTIDDTCRVWNCFVETPGSMGDCEHLRDQFRESISLKANQLVWMTDSCPHEAIPQIKSSRRQFFRLVTSRVDLWYKAHSTPNPLVDLPERVRVIEKNKFS